KARGQPEPEPPLPKPQLRKKIIRDTTTEAAAKLLSENPDGLFAHFDELASLFGGMNAYKARSGSDRPFWQRLKRATATRSTERRPTRSMWNTAPYRFSAQFIPTN